MHADEIASSRRSGPRPSCSLTSEELRHVRSLPNGSFIRSCDSVASLDFWRIRFCDEEIAAGKALEFSCDLLIMFEQGPQSRTSSLELAQPTKSAPAGSLDGSRGVQAYLAQRFSLCEQAAMEIPHYLEVIGWMLPDIRSRMFHVPIHLYALVGALWLKQHQTWFFPNHRGAADHALRLLEVEIEAAEPPRQADRYLAASGADADDRIPRGSRFEILANLLSPSYSRGPLDPRALAALMRGRLDIDWAEESLE